MHFDALHRLIDDCEKIEVRTHDNADADAIGSGLALQMALEGLGRESTFSARTVSKLGRVLARTVGRDVTISQEPLPSDLRIYVDDRPSTEASSAEKIAVIDHHEGPIEAHVSFSYLDPRFTSSSEMVFEFAEFLMRRGRLEGMPVDMGRLLLWGIIADTRGFRLATAGTMERVLRICTASGVEPRDVYPMMKTPQDPSLRIACLKGASRLKIRNARGWIMVTTTVSSFHGDVASSLTSLGADVAFAGGKKKGEITISGRASSEICDMGLNLAPLMVKIARVLGGKGGGHAGAAALKGHGNLDEALDLCARETTKALGSLKDR